MHKIVVLYNPPSDPAHFRDYYANTHLPIAKGLPGMIASRHSFGLTAPDGTSPWFCIWEGDFASEADALAAMASETGQAVAQDAANYADGGLVLFHFAAQEG